MKQSDARILRQMAGPPAGHLHSNPVTRWSWGAFSLYGVWGPAMGMWWMLPVALLFWWLFPIPNLVFGHFGRRWAWRRQHSQGLDTFARRQRCWDRVGLAVAVFVAVVAVVFVVSVIVI